MIRSLLLVCPTCADESSDLLSRVGQQSAVRLSHADRFTLQQKKRCSISRGARSIFQDDETD